MAFRRFAASRAGMGLSEAMARLNARHPWSHNDHFIGWILNELPDRRRSAVDVGCGRGELAAALSPQFETVRAMDADEQMVPVKDPALSFDELRTLAASTLPGSVMRRHLGFRHTLSWTRPS